jgi:hypothetical protein
VAKPTATIVSLIRCIWPNASERSKSLARSNHRWNFGGDSASAVVAADQSFRSALSKSDSTSATSPTCPFIELVWKPKLDLMSTRASKRV